MGLSSNMWASVSGLLQHGEKMGVIGNNIANISTIGFKSQRMDFEDFLYQDGFSASGPTQLGRGVGVSAIMSDFSQGGIESTNDPTDLLISGDGFFQVKDPFSSQVQYTRAGNFRFDNVGVLRSPAGFALQGWEIPAPTNPNISIGGEIAEAVAPSALQGTGNPKDIRFNSTTLSPQQTTFAEMTVQLNSSPNGDKTSDPNNPMFSLFGAWDGHQPPDSPGKAPIAQDSYMYPSTMTVFDEGGTERTLTTYFDQVNPKSIKNLPGGYQVYEFMLTMDPAEDVRTYGGVYDQATGTLKDWNDPYWADGGPLEAIRNATNPWADYTSGSMADAGTVGTASFGTTKSSKGDILTALNTEIDILNAAIVPAPVPALPASALTEKDVQIAKYPSGGWYLDPNDPSTKRILDADTAAIAAAAAGGPAYTTSGSITALRGASTPDPAILGDFTTDPPTFANPADPLDGNVVKNMSESDKAGILMMGTMTFDKAGNMISQSAYTYNGATALGVNEVSNADPNNLENWQPAPVSSSGYPVFTANFSGHPLANSPLQNADLNNINDKDAASYLIEFSLGMKSNLITNPWNNPTGNAATAGTDYTERSHFTNATTTNSTSTAYASASSSNSPSQNGYSFGSLSNYHIDSGGILYGIYSNGITKPLYQVAVYDFNNPQGLRREGGNAFSATEDSGQPRVGPAGQNGLGEIASYAVEQSNVDMSREFVQMISTQRGYQANSKTITTTDSMLETVINIVR